LGQTVGIAVLGALWAARVVIRQGALPAGGATAASEAVQVAALNDTYTVSLVLTALALGLAVWGLIQERRTASKRAMRSETPV
jgi:hypothetical protein